MDQMAKLWKVQYYSQFYLKYGRMFQSALNLYLIGHTLDHSGLVHGFFVNLQTEERNERNNYQPDTRGFQSVHVVLRPLNLETIINLSLTRGDGRDYSTPLGAKT